MLYIHVPRTLLMLHCKHKVIMKTHITLFCLAQMLLDFLDKVAKEPANKMTAENVAMVMAPNLFLVSSGSRNRPQAVDRELKLAKATSKVTLLLLANRSSLWTVNRPPCIWLLFYSGEFNDDSSLMISALIEGCTQNAELLVTELKRCHCTVPFPVIL